MEPFPAAIFERGRLIMEIETDFILIESEWPSALAARLQRDGASSFVNDWNDLLARIGTQASSLTGVPGA